MRSARRRRSWKKAVAKLELRVETMEKETGGDPNQSLGPDSGKAWAQVSGAAQAALWSDSAEAFLRIGDLERAKDCCYEAMQLDPSNMKPHHLMESCLMRALGA